MNSILNSEVDFQKFSTLKVFLEELSLLYCMKDYLSAGRSRRIIHVHLVRELFKKEEDS